MRTVFRVLAWIVAIEVVVQAMSMVYGVAGELKWIQGGGVLDKAAMESEEIHFPEVVGYIIHGMNGMMVIPAIALLLLISSFFTRIPRAWMWAGLVLVLVVLQIVLGLMGPSVPIMGALHGLNALLLFSAAIYTARLGRTAAAPAAEPEPQMAADR